MQSPAIIDRFEIREGLARGGMSSVYRAFDPQRGCDVAIKVLHQKYASDAGHRQRFEREVRAVSHLNHPNIVRIFDYGGSPDDRLYLVMELIRGPDLSTLVDTHGPLPPRILTAVAIQLAGALAHAHDNGIIHRDLKPENVFVDHGRVVLADFGIVKAIHDGSPLGTHAASPQTAIIGTPGYMAPELLEQKPLDERADWFSFGALLYVLGSAAMPYEGANAYVIYHSIKNVPAVALSDRCPAIPRQLSDLVGACLSFERSQRPASAAAVLERLEAIRHELDIADPKAEVRSYQEAPYAAPKVSTANGTGAPLENVLRTCTVVDPSGPSDLMPAQSLRTSDLEPDRALHTGQRTTTPAAESGRLERQGSQQTSDRPPTQHGSLYDEVTARIPVAPNPWDAPYDANADATSTDSPFPEPTQVTALPQGNIAPLNVDPTHRATNHAAASTHPAKKPNAWDDATSPDYALPDGHAQQQTRSMAQQPSVAPPAPMETGDTPTASLAPPMRQAGSRPQTQGKLRRSDSQHRRAARKRQRKQHAIPAKHLWLAAAVAVVAASVFLLISSVRNRGIDTQGASRQTATLAVHASTPTDVYVDDKAVGRTPLNTLDIRPHKRTLEVRRLGTDRIRQTINVEPGENIRVFVDWTHQTLRVSRNAQHDPSPAGPPLPMAVENE